MTDHSRRTILRSLAAGFVGIGGVGTVAAQSTEDVHDGLEELHEAVRDLRAAIEQAVDLVEGAEFRDGDSDVLDEVDDGLVINGVPVGRAESADNINESAISRIGDDVVINNIPLRRALERSRGANSSTDDSETDPPDPQSAGFSEPSQFGGFDPDGSDSAIDSEIDPPDPQSVESSEPTQFDGFDPDVDHDDPANSETDGQRRSLAHLRAEEAIQDIREERAETAELLAELDAGGSPVLERNHQRVRQLLARVEEHVDATASELETDPEAAAERLRTLEETVDGHVERLEERVDDFEDDDEF